MLLYLLGASSVIWMAALIGEILSLSLGLFLLYRHEGAAEREAQS